ncbi:MAG: bifunctional homocysteine S-methyltransferase/methylenetetrahydrofolate reductase, partial [Verrucomicrobia bacterium]|nr:bifunctional homocysteine S-methyltransferase/methylenetetrahydrofolate reductase [Verrucomicrobiota bacterium]
NTFGANRLKLDKFGLGDQVRAINQRGAELAVELARPRGAFVAGSVGPLLSQPGESLDPATREVLYREHIAGLLAGGVDALFIETFTRVPELTLAVSVAKSLSNKPVLASLSFSDDGHTADGLRINEAFAKLRAAGADVTGINCHFGPAMTETILRELIVQAGELISVFPNAGRPQFFEGRYIYHPTPQYFADSLPRLVAQGARLIGGCCGTTPETIAAMAKVLPDLKAVSVKLAPFPGAEVIAPRPAAVAPAQPQTVLEVIRQRTLIVTELDPPKSLSLDKMVEGARALREAGTDFVTMADNSLAILRVSNMATGFLVKERTGVEPIIHLSCRDENLLGLQSRLMGFHALGIHHILALTGDPAKVGDHPAASSVYDVNSIGLIKTIARLNEGFAANGRDLKGRTHFIIGCAFNPNAKNLDSQVRKLEDKVKAGAHFVMTQPIFDAALAKATHEKTKHFGIPVLVGVMPVLNARNTEFLHNEVPGIVIPDSIRQRMRGKDGAEGNAEGLSVARDLCDAVLEYFKGIYLITPLMRFDMTVELSRHVRVKTK